MLNFGLNSLPSVRATLQLPRRSLGRICEEA